MDLSETFQAVTQLPGGILNFLRGDGFEPAPLSHHFFTPWRSKKDFASSLKNFYALPLTSFFTGWVGLGGMLYFEACALHGLVNGRFVRALSRTASAFLAGAAFVIATPMIGVSLAFAVLDFAVKAMATLVAAMISPCLPEAVAPGM